MTSGLEIKLINRLQNSDVKAFDLLFRKYSRNLYHFAFSLLKNQEDAEGIVQEVFLRIWNRRVDIDSTRSFKSYLFTISYNLIIDELRLRLKEKKYIHHLEKFFNTEEIITENEAGYNLLKSQIEQVMEKLPDKRKMIYKLSRVEGLSNKEISEKLNISVKTVENQINLAIKFLKLRLGKDILAAALFISVFG